MLFLNKHSENADLLGPCRSLFPILYQILWIITALQCGHATVIKVFKKALGERRPPWPMQIIINGSLPAQQCGHATAIKFFKQARREHRPP